MQDGPRQLMISPLFGIFRERFLLGDIHVSRLRQPIAVVLLVVGSRREEHAAHSTQHHGEIKLPYKNVSFIQPSCQGRRIRMNRCNEVAREISSAAMILKDLLDIEVLSPSFEQNTTRDSLHVMGDRSSLF